MKLRYLRYLLPFTLSLSLLTGEEDDAKQEKEDDKKAAKEVVSETEHSVTIGGQAIDYVARAGKLPLKKEDGTVRVSIFYIAYERQGVSEGTKRPVTCSRLLS